MYAVCILYVRVHSNIVYYMRMTWLYGPTSSGPVLTHEVTTYGGSSGAPIVKAVNGELVVVAVHAGTIPPDRPKVNVAYLLSDILYHLLNKSLK